MGCEWTAGADLLRFGLEQGTSLPQAPAPQKGKIALPFFPSVCL